MTRTMTRRERYTSKDAIELPIEVGCVNFGDEKNFLQACRAAACFGAKNIHLVGNCSLPRDEQRNVSGTTIDFLNVNKYSNPKELIDYAEKNRLKIVALELPQDCGLKATPLDEYIFNNEQGYLILSGNENVGVPSEILYYRNTDIVYIRMPGLGYCLNTSQALNVALYEASKQLV